MQQTVKYTSPIMKYININISQFHGIPWNSPEVPWNSMELFQVKREVPWNSMEFWKFHGTWCQHQIPWNSMESPDLEQKFHGIPWNFNSCMHFVRWGPVRFGTQFAELWLNVAGLFYETTSVYIRFNLRWFCSQRFPASEKGVQVPTWFFH